MNRMSRQQGHMETAEVWAKRSTCGRGNVGAVVVRGRDTWIGYNGPPSGHDHCYGNDCPTSESGGCSRSIHAELNAITLAKNALRTKLYDCDLYCTYSPCVACAEETINSFVRRFFYRYSYRDPVGLQMLRESPHLKGVYRIGPSGQIVCARTNMFVDPADL